MAILDKLLNRKVTESSSNKPKQVRDLSSLSQKDLIATIKSDDKLNIRCEAIKYLQYGEDLLQFAFDEQIPVLARAGQQRIADLIDTGKLGLPEFKQQANLDQQIAVAALTTSEEIQQEILSQIKDQSSLAKLAIEHRTASVRLWAAEQIKDVDLLADLLKHSKNKDKNVFKLVKSKLELQQEQEKQQRLDEQKLSTLLNAVEKHSRTSYDHLYEAKKDHLLQQWRDLETKVEPNIEAKINSAFHECDKVIELSQAAQMPKQPIEEVENKEEGSELVQEEAPVLDVDLVKLQSQKHELIDSVSKVLESLVVSEDAVDKAHTELNVKHISERWLEVLRYVEVSKQEKDGFEGISKSITIELDKIQRYGSIKTHFKTLKDAELALESYQLAKQEKAIAVFKKRLDAVGALEKVASEEIQTLFDLFEEWQRERKSGIDVYQNLIRQLTGMIRKTRIALDMGKTSQAHGVRASIEEKRQKIENLPRHIEKQIQELDEQLIKVKDWREYATLPKKEELVEKMQTLVDCGEKPDALATKIKRLQDEWKLLSKGGYSDDDGLWERFKQAGDEAYKPCAVYFENLGQQRAENLEKRKNLVKQLQEYDSKQDWENADWRQVAKLMQVAFDEWKSYQPVERSANKPVQKDFDMVIATIRTKLDDEHKKNKTAKKTLIDQAKSLVEAEDNRQAIESIKQLQARWKQLGSASHKADQSLWKEFRAQCDAVFEKRKQLSAEFKSELNTNKERAVVFCEELETISKNSLSELLASRERVAEIHTEFQAIGQLPKAQANEINTRFRQAKEGFEKKIRDQQAQQKASAWDGMLNCYGKLTELHHAIESGAGKENVLGEADALLQQELDWPKSSLAILTGHFKSMENGSISVDLEEKLKERRLLCIKAEILADIETPAEDQGLRMEYQVQQLAKGFGQRSQQFKNGREAMEALMLEWVALEPVYQQNYSAITSRLQNARKKMGV